MALVSRSVTARTALFRWSREQLRQILGAVSDGVTVQDSAGNLVFANGAAARLLGYPDEETLLATPVDEIFGSFEVLDEQRHPFPVERLPGRRALAGEIDVPQTLLLFRFVGTAEERWAWVSARPLYGDDGKVQLAVNTFEDVTERRANEQRMTLQADLLDRVDAAIVATDLSGAVTHWNQGAVTLFEVPEAKAIGRSYLDVVAPNVSLGEEQFALARAGRRWEGSGVVVGESGRTTPAYLSLAPIRDGRANVSGISLICLDLTEQRRIELERRASDTRFRLLFDSLPHVVWMSSRDGNVQRINARYAEYTGLRQEQVEGSQWANLVHQDDMPAVLEAWEEAWRTRREYEVEFRLRRGDGSYRWHMGRILPLLDDRGEVTGWLGTGTDIEDRKRAERSLSFLAKASRVLSGSLDYEGTLASLAELAVPEIADWCAIDLLDERGEVEMVGVAHVDPDKVELAHEIRRRWPPKASEMSVLSTLRPQLHREITDEMIEAIPYPEEREILRDLGLRSAMVVPLVTDGRAIGTISFFTAESGRRFEDADAALAEDLAGRAAAAIEHARLYRSLVEFKGAVDNATDAIYMYDPATLRFTYVNRGAREQVGYSAEELLEMTPVDVKPEFDVASYRAMIAPLVEGASDSHKFQTVQRRKDGTVYPVDVVLQRVQLHPDAIRLIAFVRDVTERADTQARLQRLAQAERARAAEVNAVIRAMGEAVLVFDAGGQLALANPAADALLPGATLRAWSDLTELFDDPSGEMPALGSDRPHGPVELRLREQRRWVEVTAYPVLIGDGPLPQAALADHAGVTILVMRDVTEQREAAAMRRAFVGVLSHELRTPVTTIYGSSKVLGKLGERISDGQRREVLSDIEAESERLYRLVEDLLVLARFGDEPMVLGDEPVLLQRILPATLASEQNRWPGTRFELMMAPGLPTVRADPTYVEQVARNLLANAAKYGQQGGHVRLILEPGGDPERSEVVVRVRDDGPGFPAEETDRLFELFYRSPLTAGQASGAGIGLFVCRRLIEAMGGRIWATSLPEGGAEFGFTLRAFEDDE